MEIFKFPNDGFIFHGVIVICVVISLFTKNSVVVEFLVYNSIIIYCPNKIRRNNYNFRFVDTYNP